MSKEETTSLVATRAEAAELFAGGETLRQVAELVGVSYPTVKHWHEADRWPALRRKRRDEARQLAARRHEAAMQKALQGFGSKQAEIIQAAQRIVAEQLEACRASPAQVEVAMRTAKHAQSIANDLTGGGSSKGKGGGGVRVNILTQAAHVQAVTEE